MTFFAFETIITFANAFVFSIYKVSHLAIDGIDVTWGLPNFTEFTFKVRTTLTDRNKTPIRTYISFTLAIILTLDIVTNVCSVFVFRAGIALSN